MKKGSTKPWVKRCFLLALALLLFAGVLYAVHYIQLDKEFGYACKYYDKDTYSEIFALSDNSDKAEPILALGREAFSFVGSEEEAEARFGVLSRYCCTAASQKFTLDHIVSEFDGDSGYVWVAYTRYGYDADDSLVYDHFGGEFGKDRRTLSRWSVEKQDGTWVVTAIDEAP